MHADETLGAHQLLSHLRDAQGGGIGDKDPVGWTQFRQLLEEPDFQVEFFWNCFDQQIRASDLDQSDVTETLLRSVRLSPAVKAQRLIS